MLADETAQHLVDGAHDVVEIEDDRLDDFAAAEREQLPRQLSRGLARLLNLEDVVAVAVQNLRVVQQQLAVAQDGGEHVVEVVGNSPGQTPNRVHLLRAVIVLLELLALHLGEQALLFPFFKARRHRVEILRKLAQLGDRRAGGHPRTEVPCGQTPARARKLVDWPQQETIGRHMDAREDDARDEAESEQRPIHRLGRGSDGLGFRDVHADAHTALQRHHPLERHDFGDATFDVFDDARRARAHLPCQRILRERVPEAVRPTGIHRQDGVIAIRDDDGRIARPVVGTQTVAQPPRVNGGKHDALHDAGSVHIRKRKRYRWLSSEPSDVVFADDESLGCDGALKIAAVGDRQRAGAQPAADHHALRVDDAQVRVHRSELRHHAAEICGARPGIAVAHITTL